MTKSFYQGTCSCKMGFISHGIFLLAIATGLLIESSFSNSNHAEVIESSSTVIITTTTITLPAKNPKKESHCTKKKRRRKQKRRSCKEDAGLCKRLSWDHDHLTCCFNRWCVDIFASQFNCGSCGHICKGVTRCCGGICVDIKNDPKNCGDCRNVCLHDENCEFGMCGYD